MRTLGRAGGVIAALTLMTSLLGAVPARAATHTYTFESCMEGWTGKGGTPDLGWRRQPIGDGSNYSMGHQPYRGNDSDERVVSQPHAWPGGKVTVKFSLRWQYEPPELGTDLLTLEWASDGKTWKRIQRYAGTTNKAFPSYDKLTVSFDAPPGSFQLRFRMTADALIEGIGPALDNIVVPTAAPDKTKC